MCTLCLLPQVSVRSPTTDTHSATITNEDLPRSDTNSTAVEVETNGSVEASAYVSVEGNGAQTIDKVHDGKKEI